MITNQNCSQRDYSVKINNIVYDCIYSLYKALSWLNTGLEHILNVALLNC